MLAAVRARVAAWLRSFADRLAVPEEEAEAGGPPEHWRRMVAERAPQLLRHPPEARPKRIGSIERRIPADRQREDIAVEPAAALSAVKAPTSRDAAPLASSARPRPRRVAPVAQKNEPPFAGATSKRVAVQDTNRLQRVPVAEAAPQIDRTRAHPRSTLPPLGGTPAKRREIRVHDDPAPAPRSEPAWTGEAPSYQPAPVGRVRAPSIVTDPTARRKVTDQPMTAAIESGPLDRWPSLPESAPLPALDRTRIQRLTALDNEQMS